MLGTEHEINRYDNGKGGGGGGLRNIVLLRFLVETHPVFVRYFSLLHVFEDLHQIQAFFIRISKFLNFFRKFQPQLFLSCSYFKYS